MAEIIQSPSLLPIIGARTALANLVISISIHCLNDIDYKLFRNNMLTIYKLRKQKLLLTRHNVPWDRPRISREARKLGAKLAKTPYGLSYEITDDILARLLASCTYAKTHVGRRKKASKNTP